MQDHFKWFFCFVFLGNDIFISDRNVNAKSNREIETAFFFHSLGKMSVIASLQTNTYLDELLKIFLKLSTKTVQVHLIIGTTL